LSRYNRDCEEISNICFMRFLTQKEKNYYCSIIEKRMSEEEDLELSGKGTGYYD